MVAWHMVGYGAWQDGEGMQHARRVPARSLPLHSKARHAPLLPGQAGCSLATATQPPPSRRHTSTRPSARLPPRRSSPGT